MSKLVEESNSLDVFNRSRFMWITERSEFGFCHQRTNIWNCSNDSHYYALSVPFLSRVFSGGPTSSFLSLEAKWLQEISAGTKICSFLETKHIARHNNLLFFSETVLEVSSPPAGGKICFGGVILNHGKSDTQSLFWFNRLNFWIQQGEKSQFREVQVKQIKPSASCTCDVQTLSLLTFN